MNSSSEIVKQPNFQRTPHRSTCWRTLLRPSIAVIGALCVTSLVHADQITIDSRDFIPIFGDSVYAESSAGNLVCTGGNGSQLFIAQLPLPPAPVELDLKQLAVWGGDFSAADSTVNLDRYCQTEFSASIPVKTAIAEVSSSGSSGVYFDAFSLNRRVEDQQTCIYMLSVQLGINGCSGGNNLSVGRVRVRFDVVQPVVVDPIFNNGFE